MNGLSNNIYPYSLNNLQTITTSDGGTLPVSCNAPLIENTTSTNQNIYLYESSTDLIDFNTYSKSLRVKDLIANTGTFSAIYSTGARFFTLNATGVNVDTLTATTSIYSAGSLNAPNADVSVYGITADLNGVKSRGGFTGAFITAGSGTFQNVNTNVLTANTINISSLNIPNLQFTFATGGFVSTTGTISTQQNFRTTNGINTFDFTDISSNGDTSIYNAGGALQTSFRFDGNERMKLSSAGKLDVSFLQSSGAFTGTSIATTSTIRSGGVLSTTSGRIANGNTAWTTNSNDVFINANNDTVYFRPKGETATPADAQVYILNNGNMVCSTGTLIVENIYSNRGANFPSAYVDVYGINASFQINSPYFTGTSCSIATIKGATGIFSNTITAPYIKPTTELQIRNGGGYLSFYNGNGDKFLEAQPSALTSKILSWYDYQPGTPKLQMLWESQASGAYLSYINKVELLDYLYTPTTKCDAFYTTTANGLQTNQMTFYNNTSNQSRPFVFQNLNQSAYIQAYGANNRNNGFAIRDTSERWFIYNQANTSTLAINNNSSDLITLNSTTMNITPQVNITNTLQVGQSNFGVNALINLGFSGTLGGTNNTRQGYVYMDGSYMVLNNQQFNNANRNNSSIGHIQLTPANGGAGQTIIAPNGAMAQTSTAQAQAGASFTNLASGAYGVYINQPNNGLGTTLGNNYYALVIQGSNYTPALTFHPSVSNGSTGVNSNITIGRLNYPSGNESITIRPYSTFNNPTWIRMSNNYLDDTAQGTFTFGIWGTGNSGIEADVFLNNYATNASGRKSGIRFQTDTATYGTTTTAQYIDYTGQTFFNPYTNRNTFTPKNTQTGSAFSVNYGFYSLPDVGTSFFTSNGAGKYIPRLKWNLNNASYTVAGGIQKIAGTTNTQTDHSNYITTAGARQYSFRCDIEGVYDIRWNVNLFTSAGATSWYFYVYKNGANVSQSNGYVNLSQFSYCNGTTLLQCNAGDDIDFRIQADVNTISVVNESWGMMMYVG